MSFTPKLRSEYIQYNLMKIQTGWAIDLNLNCRLDSLNFNQFVSSEICSEGVEKLETLQTFSKAFRGDKSAKQ